MKAIGCGGSGHDFSTCIIENHNVVCYVKDERILRKKHSFFPGMGQELLKTPALNYCLDYINSDPADIDYIVANNSVEKYYYARFSRKKDILFINHHLAHAASAFYPSPFKDAAILVVDGAGKADEENMLDSISFWTGSENKITKIASHGGRPISRKLYDDMIDPAENSIGAFFHVVTFLVGFGPFDQGKTMGLAPYGTAKYYSKLRELIDFGPEGSFVFPLEAINSLLDFGKTIDLNDFSTQADLAWAGQKIVEEAILHAALFLKQATNLPNICIAGGVALNSVANYKLYKAEYFSDFFIQPSAADAGTSIGAAYYGVYGIGKLERLTG